MIDPAAAGEHPCVPECVVVAPATGVFRPVNHDGWADGAVVQAGQAIGTVEAAGVATPVHSRFTGSLMGMLVHANERVREGQPVAWLRSLVCT